MREVPKKFKLNDFFCLKFKLVTSVVLWAVNDDHILGNLVELVVDQHVFLHVQLSSFR